MVLLHGLPARVTRESIQPEDGASSSAPAARREAEGRADAPHEAATARPGRLGRAQEARLGAEPLASRDREPALATAQVGDNPTSDMEGVRRANIHHARTTTQWKGVLVRTGVYKEGDETNGAHIVVEGIEQAVDWILEQESGAQPPPAKKQRA